MKKPLCSILFILVLLFPSCGSDNSTFKIETTTFMIETKTTATASETTTTKKQIPTKAFSKKDALDAVELVRNKLYNGDKEMVFSYAINLPNNNYHIITSHIMAEGADDYSILNKHLVVEGKIIISMNDVGGNAFWEKVDEYK